MTVFMCVYLHYRVNKQWDTSFEFSSVNSLDCWSFKTFNHRLNHSKIHTAHQDFHSLLFLFRQSSMVKPLWTGTFRKWAIFLNFNTGSFYLQQHLCENLSNVEPFFLFYIEPVMLGPHFIPESIFYTQSVMLSPRYTWVCVLYPVRSP